MLILRLVLEHIIPNFEFNLGNTCIDSPKIDMMATSQATMTSFFSTQSTGNSISLAEAGNRSPSTIRAAPQERKRANPAPLGLCAFAFTIFLFGCVQIECKGVSRPDIIIAPALVYGGLIQVLSGMWYVRNNRWVLVEVKVCVC